MQNRRLVTLVGCGVVGLVVLGGCADAPVAGPQAASVAPAAAAAPAHQDQAPCTQRLRPGAGAAGPNLMALTPEARAEIDRLRALTPEQQTAEAQGSQARDPELTARLADVRRRVEQATRPCTDR